MHLFNFIERQKIVKRAIPKWTLTLEKKSFNTIPTLLMFRRFNLFNLNLSKQITYFVRNKISTPLVSFQGTWNSHRRFSIQSSQSPTRPDLFIIPINLCLINEAE